MLILSLFALSAFGQTNLLLTLSFTNASSIIGPDYGAASPYPSTIELSGLSGVITKATATLSKLSHTDPSDFDILLVGPAGQKLLLMASCGGATLVNNVTLTLDDAAASALPQSSQLTSGTFKPANYGTPTFTAPAPAGPYPNPQLLSVFNGTNPNGTWSLYVYDGLPQNSGTINGGWSLSLSLSNSVCCPGGTNADLSVTVTDSPDPVQPGSNITYTATVINNGPGSATGAVVTNTLPTGVSFISVRPSQGTATNNGAVVTCNIGNLAVGAVATVSIVGTAPTSGTLTNTAIVKADQNDTNVVNNTAATITSVGLPTLAISISDVSLYEGDSGTTQAVFNVSLTRTNGQFVSVDYSTTDGTAVAGTDYGTVSDTLFFSPGVTNQTISVPVYGNIIVEPTKTFFVNLTNAVNVPVARSTATGTILNDDGLPGQLDHFILSTVSSPQYVSSPFAMTVTAKDASNNNATNFNGAATLKGLVGSGAEVSVVISEIDTGPTNNVEFANVAGAPIDISNWQLTIYDWASWPSPDYVFTIPAGTICASNQIFVLTEGGTAPGIYPRFSSGGIGYWLNDPTNNQVAVLLQNATGKIIDFACAFDADPTQIALPLAISTNQWTGLPIAANTNALKTFQRTGHTNSHTSADWTISTSTIGALNPGFSTPFSGGLPVTVSPTLISNFVSGVWTGSVTVLRATTNMYLRAVDIVGHTGTGNTFTVSPTNHPPTLAPIPDQTIVLGGTLYVTNSAADIDPGQTLTFSLASGAPTGATINSTNGIFSWTPLAAQSPSTNSIAVRVVDNGTPILSATQAFKIFVKNPVVQTPLLINRLAHMPGTNRLHYTTLAGYAYQIQSRPTSSTGSWTSLTNFTVSPVISDVVFSDIIGTNRQRFYRVKNVTIPFSPPQIIGASHSPAAFNLTFRGEAGRTYAIEYLNSLTTGAWALLTNLSVPAITNAVTMLLAPDAGQLDYRVNQLTIPVPAPRLDGITLGAEIATLRFTALPGLPYVLEYRDDLDAGSWFALATVGPLTNAVQVFVSDLVGAQPHRLYRLNIAVPSQSAAGVSIERSPESIDVYFSGAAGQQYTVQYSAALNPAGWLTVTNGILPAAGTNVVAHDYDVGYPQRFYRIKSP